MINIYKDLLETNTCFLCFQEISRSLSFFYHKCGNCDDGFDTLTVDENRYEVALNDDKYFISDKEQNSSYIWILEKNNFRSLYTLDYFYEVEKPYLKNINLFVEKICKLKLFI